VDVPLPQPMHMDGGMVSLIRYESAWADRR
jgi:hypothetical protein